MKNTINELKKIFKDPYKNTTKENEDMGRDFMLYLIKNSNFLDISNPIIRFKKLASKIYRNEETNKIEKFCKQIGLKEK